jgi:hypothetical protein
VSIPDSTTSRRTFSFRPPTRTPTPKSDDDELSRSFVGGEPTIHGGPFRHSDWASSSAWQTNPETEPEQRSETASDPEELIERTPGTNTDDDSFHTAAVLSEPAENLFAAILGQRSSLSEGSTEQPKTPEPEISKPNMAAPMIIDNRKKTQELKLNQPKAFGGKWDELTEFLQDVQLYLAVNDDIYNTDKKKIAFTLSFMSEGDVKSWKGQFLQNVNKPTGLDLGTWAQFQVDITAAFQPYNAPGDALKELMALKMRTNSIKDHIAKYKILLSRSGILETSPSAIDYFQKTLNVPLQRKLLELPTPPSNLKEWYEWASRLNNNYRKMQRILGRGQTTVNNGKGKEEPRWRWSFQAQRKYLNAMDIDVIATTMNTMTIEKWEKFIKEGLCFRCRKPGHISRDCPLRKGNIQILTWPAMSTTPPKNMKGSELVAHIRSLTATLDKGELQEFLDLA